MTQNNNYEDGLKGKTAIITGATGGIGKEIAIFLSKIGVNIVINYRTNELKANEIVSVIKESQGQCIKFKANVSDEDEVINMVKSARDNFGSIDILINNAAIYSDSASWKMPISIWNDIIQTDLTGVFICSKIVIPFMRKQEWGRIINISSVVGNLGIFGTSNYAAAKSGVNGLTRTLAVEVANKNITVNALVLGYFDTGMFKSLSESKQTLIANSIPLKRAGNLNELVHSIRFFLSKHASYITGQNIEIDGGFSIASLIQ